MKPYNGFSAKERIAGGIAQRKAAQRGEFEFPTTCSICGFSPPPEFNFKSRYIVAHLEDYRRPLDCLPCCRKCHFALHRRFTRPNAWLSVVALHGREGAWFTGLTMDPNSQTRNFDETYTGSLGSNEKR